MRQGAKAPEAAPFGAINVSWNTMDPHNAFMRFIDSQQVPPKGSNWGYINDPAFDALAKEARSTSDPAALDKVLARINTKMVDDAVFVWVVHDVWPNAISSKVKGYVHPKSSDVDFSPVTVGERRRPRHQTRAFARPQTEGREKTAKTVKTDGV